MSLRFEVPRPGDRVVSDGHRSRFGTGGHEADAWRAAEGIRAPAVVRYPEPGWM